MQNGSTLVGLELDTTYRDDKGLLSPKFRVLFNIEIPRSQFTYKNAVDKIIQLNDEYDFDWIAVDRGYGETQIELLHDYGLKNPETGLADKVVGYQFSQKVEVRDPHTGKKDMKHLKPFMVNNSINVFEKYKIVLNPSDHLLIEQLGAYAVKSISSTGMPSYTDENEHALDALNLCLLIFEQKYNPLMQRIFSTKVLGINALDQEYDRAVKSRTEFEKPKTVTKVNLPGVQNAYVKDMTIASSYHKKRRQEASTRRMF